MTAILDFWLTANPINCLFLLRSGPAARFGDFGESSFPFDLNFNIFLGCEGDSSGIDKTPLGGVAGAPSCSPDREKPDFVGDIPSVKGTFSEDEGVLPFLRAGLDPGTTTRIEVSMDLGSRGPLSVG